MKLSSFFDSPSRWVQECFAADMHGSRVDLTDHRACKFCVLGYFFIAVDRHYVSSRESDTRRKAFAQYAWEHLDDNVKSSLRSKSEDSIIIAFNDSMRSFEEFHSHLLAFEKEYSI